MDTRFNAWFAKHIDSSSTFIWIILGKIKRSTHTHRQIKGPDSMMSLGSGVGPV